LIRARFEDVIVQKSPAAPVHSEHSFVTWSSLLRSEDADTAATPLLSPTLRAAYPASGTRARAKTEMTVLNFIASLSC
jgi:hypothetical protein